MTAAAPLPPLPPFMPGADWPPPLRPRGGRRTPEPLPSEPRLRALRAHVAAQLPRLRDQPVPPLRHRDLTLLLYYFSLPGAPQAEADAFEFALRQTWAVLGALPTVVVVPRRTSELPAWLALPGVEVQEAPDLRPGDVSTMSRDCLLRLHTRFATRHVLVIQNDGWPLRDEIDAFLQYDYVGAPNVHSGWRGRVADALCLTVLNGGFSLRSRRLCRAVASAARCFPSGWAPPEDRVFSRFRPFFRFPSAAVAHRFSEDSLDGLLPPAPGTSPMGFHRASTFAALTTHPGLTVVSVVRDKACFRRCLAENPVLAGARFAVRDNTQENLPIPLRYNAFLDALPPGTEWILFAHEDFQPLEDPRPLLARRSTLFPCGIIGSRLVAGVAVLPFGVLTDSDRDGGRMHRNAPPFPYAALLGSSAENCDCCALFVHADAIRAWHLRFDPACAWDLYVEDFCFRYLRQSGHRVDILPLKAHHWSRGNPFSARFRQTLDYLNRKYADDLFAGGSCAFTIGRTPALPLRLFRLMANVYARIFCR